MLLMGLREQVLQTSLRLLEDGVIHGSQGNVSAIDRERGLVAITPSSIPYTELSPEDICVVDEDRKVREGKRKPTSEIALHLAFYKRRADVGAVVHTHPPYATAFGVIGSEPLPIVLVEAAMWLGGPVPVAPYARPGSDRVAEVTAEKTGSGPGAIMAHHGLVTVGPNLDFAYERTIAVESGARLVVLARSMGKEVLSLDEEEVASLHRMLLAMYSQPRETTA